MCYGNQTWSEESLMWVYNDDDLHGGQRSSEVKCGKLCAMATKLGQKNPWCKFMMMMTFMKVKGHQRLNVVNVALWLPNLVRKNPWCKFMMVMTFMKVRGHQRSNVANFALWLPTWSTESLMQVRFLLACLIKIVNLSYEVHPFWLCSFWFLSGGVRGPLSIAHVFVISVFRSFDGLPRCDKTTSSKSWPSSRVHQLGCSLHWQFAGFSIAPMRCLLFRL